MVGIGANRDALGRGRTRQQGVTSIEYALIGALIAVFIVASVARVGDAVLALFFDVAAGVACASRGGC